MFRLFVKYLIFFKKKVSIMSCWLLCKLFLLTLTYFLSLLPPDFAHFSKLLVFFSQLIHFINLYKNSSDQEISPNVNNKYL
eukprot:bmy_00661T0